MCFSFVDIYHYRNTIRNSNFLSNILINFNFFQDGNILPLSHLASPALSLSLHEWLNTVTCPVNVGLCFDIINAMLQLCAALYESSSAGEYASVALTRHRRIVRSVPTDFQLILSVLYVSAHKARMSRQYVLFLWNVSACGITTRQMPT